MPLRTPINLFRSVTFVGTSGAGTATATGIRAGDQVAVIFGAPTAGGALVSYRPGVDFEAFASADNQLKQLSATNLSAATLIALCVPNSL
jgi:hypothetical protein